MRSITAYPLPNLHIISLRKKMSPFIRVPAYNRINGQKKIGKIFLINKDLLFLNREKEKLVDSLIRANNELNNQNHEKGKQLIALIIANEQLAFQNIAKEEQLTKITIAYNGATLINGKNAKKLKALRAANEGLTMMNEMKDKLAKEQVVFNKEIMDTEKNIHRLKEQDNVKHNEELEQKIIERAFQLESSNNELEAFSYSVAHDLRAPLRAVSAYSALLKQEYGHLLDAEGNDFINILMESSKKMGQLIDDLLKFSQLGRLESVQSNVDMNKIVKTLTEEISLTTDISKYQLKVNTLPTCTGDENMLKQVWFNLINNAFKYSRNKANPVIEIGCTKAQNELLYFIKDNGVGFDMAYKDKLFGVFQRLHSNDEFEGTGLGLSLVKRIVEKHKGRVFAESQLNHGSTFYFTIPN